MDFVVSRPAQKAPSRRGKKTTSRFAWLKFLGRRPARTILGAAFSAVLVGIAVNALFFQTARHPAPLMNTGEVKKPATSATAVPVPAPRPVEQTQQAAAPAAPQNILPAAARTAPAKEAAEIMGGAKLAATEKSSGDQIAALINKGSLAPMTSDAEKSRIHSAQRALIKLGYSIKADGVMGKSMKQAIEKFERDRSLPVTGDLSARTVRELAAQSRIAIQ
jgi:hypothetical protein